MIKGYPWFNSHLEAEVDHAVVKVESFFVGIADALRKDPGPGNREAEIFNIEIMHQDQVLHVMVVKVAADIGILIIGYLTRCTGKHIPNGQSFKILKISALGLVGRRSYPPFKSTAKIMNIHGC